MEIPKFPILFCLWILLVGLPLHAQVLNTDGSIINPNDPIVEFGEGHFYNSQNPPPKPTHGYVGKWVRTKRLNWNTDSYKAYIYKDVRIRVKFPKNYDPTSSSKYPVIVMLHGKGETGDLYDNENQLKNGGKIHSDAIDQGKWNGFVLFPQTWGGWPNDELDRIKEFIEFMAKHKNADINRINIHGLSMGGGGTWDFVLRHPHFFASALPMSGTLGQAGIDQVDKFKFTSLWISQGGKDTNPSAGWTNYVVDQIKNAGGNIRYSIYENLGHGVWDTHYQEADFFSFMSRANIVNPWALFGRTEFCPEDQINIIIGINPGYNEYQWRKNGILIDGATANTYNVTSTGIYDVRVKRGTEWSYWSPVPVEVKIKAPTVTPPIKIAEKQSWLIPSPAGESVTLALPEGYEKYSWKKIGSEKILETSRTLVVSEPGEYIATVTEKFGCSSSYSDPFSIVKSTGVNTPDPINGLNLSVLSKTSIKLNWSDKPNPSYNETGFEIYRSGTAGGPYELVHYTEADVKTYTDNSLLPGTEYFYTLRPINQYSAGSISAEVNGTTQVDTNKPMAPLNLRATEVLPESVSLVWTAATDDIGIASYNVYKNGVLVMPVKDTFATVFNLLPMQVYNFTVKAIDHSGNLSVASNQLTVATVKTGLKYAEYHGTWNALPDFSALTPVKTGTIDKIDLSNRSRNDYFGFKFEGKIQVPTSGTYKFYTTSDDGSKLYINGQEIVNNDGLHGAQERSGTVSLTAGNHSFKVEFFENGGGEALEVRWEGPGIAKQIIPSSAFKDDFTMPGTAPAAPSQLVATAVSYQQVDLSWNDNSTNETGFQIYRSSKNSGPFSPIAIVNSGVTTFQDKELSAAKTYYYRIMAIGKYGESGFSTGTESGLQYKYYEKNFSNLSQLESSSPQKEGKTLNFDLSPRNKNSYIAFSWTGKIFLDEAGQYTFYTESDDGSKLWINGTEIVNNDYNQPMKERSGTYTVTAPGVYNIKVAWRQGNGGYGLNVRYQGPGIAKKIIPDGVLKDLEVNATTFPLPAAPLAPMQLKATAISGTKIALSWQDKSTNEEGFEVFRSVSNADNFLLLEKLPKNTSSYQNKDLYSNVTYYYKIVSVGVGGTSDSAIDSARTLNTTPVLSDIANRTLKYGTTETINITAIDPDNETLAFSYLNLPSFAGFIDQNNGTAKLVLSPSMEDLGDYTNINILVNDQNGGADTVVFNLTIHNNDLPVFTSAVDNVVLAEGANTVLSFSATDHNADDTLQWEAVGLPAFASLTSADRTASINFSPGFIDAGGYEVVLKVYDGKGGEISKNFSVIVNDVDPVERVFINITGGTNAPAPWNNVSGLAASNLNNQKGENSGVGIAFQTANWATYVDGAVTGNNSGVYPDAVIREYYYFGIFGAPETVDVKVTGLDPDQEYNFSFFASSKWTNVPDNGSTIFTIGNESRALYVQNNSQNKVSINKVFPSASGEAIFTMAKAPNTPVGYFNSLVIETSVDDGNPPAAPKEVQATMVDKEVQISWKDAPFNEDGYEIYKSEQDSSGYYLLAGVGANITSFKDNLVASNTTYYYKVNAFNINGKSVDSNIASVDVPALPPTILSDSLIVVETGKSTSKFIQVLGAPISGISFSVSGLPGFAEFTDLGNGTGELVISPSSNDVNKYSGIELTATNADGSATKAMVIEVTPQKLYSVKINFTQGTIASSPWNNVTGLNSTSLLKESGENSGIGLTFQTSWWNTYTEGTVTGNNSGVVPDNVIKEYYFFGIHGGPEMVDVKVEGLDPAKLYDFTFFASSKWLGVADNGSTVFSIGNEKRTLNVQNNSQNIVKIGGVSPDVNGEVIYRMAKAAGAPVGYINGLIIDAFENPENQGGHVATELSAYGISPNQVKLNWTAAKAAIRHELYKSASQAGPYTLIFEGSSTASSYTDSGLAKGASNYYKLNTIYADGSAESQAVFGATLQSLVYMNMNGDKTYDAPAPWNNFGVLPLHGDTFGGFKNEEGNGTGIVLEFEKSFTGDNNWGMNTGDNSGIYPDNIIQSFFFMENLESSRIIVKGLDQTMGYNFVFFNSIGVENVTTAFTIGEETVLANASFNTNNVEVIRGVIPGKNSEVVMDITSNARWSIFNAMVIEIYPNGKGTNLRKSGNNEAVSFNKSVYLGATESIASTDFIVYPNPFKEEIMIKFPVELSGKMVISITDIAGKSILYQNVEVDGWSHSIDLLGQGLKAGVYLLKVKVNNEVRVVKIIKN